jgi:serine protease Do
MKNLLKFFAFVAVLSIAISVLYDYQIRHGRLISSEHRAPEKYTLPSAGNIDPKSVASLEALNRERRALINSVIPSVVAVKTSKKINVPRQYMDPSEFFFGRRSGGGRFRNPQDQGLVQNSLGSGVVVTNEGHIITNNHVVDQVDEIEVQLSDGRTKKARLVGSDAQVDIAVLKIDDPGVKPLPLADSDQVQAGDFVLAIGNPLGFEETVTDGTISWKAQPNSTDLRGDLLQTNAAINPGNSGGPLINLRGEVVGINEQIASASGRWEGIGFAIPSNTVRMALESLLKQGRIIRGYLGIQGRVDRRNPNGITDEGVVVDDVVPGSPAADAHLAKGDVIRKFDGHEVKNFMQLRSLVSQVELNKNVEIEVDRNGKPVKVMAKIREQPVDYQTTGPAPQQRQPQPSEEPGSPNEEENAGSPLASIHVGELTPELAKRLNSPNGVRGVVVTGVDAAGGTAELQKGDVIEEVNRQPVASVADYQKIVGSLDPNQPFVLSVCRGRARSFLVLRPR